MKNSKLGQKVYSRLIKRLFFQICAILAASAACVLLIWKVLRGHIGDKLVALMMVVFNISWSRAMDFYRIAVRNNMDLIVAALIVIVFFILFRLSRTWFTRYFDELAAGVDKLAEESDGEIRMSPELEFMEVKLNEVKNKLRRQAEEAQAAEQRKNDLVVYLAHDIKTPLTSVIGYLSLIEEDPEMPADQRNKYFRIALEKAYHLETLMNEFFEITRYHLQTMPLNKEIIDLSYMILQITDEMYPLLHANGNDAVIGIPEGMVICGDPEKLARVFRNILKNAAAYGKADSVIRIDSEERNDSIVIRFTNWGEIPNDQIGLIFDKFYRLDAARSTATGGAGLGLAIAKDIVELHGGTITAASGEGRTEIIIELPLPADGMPR